MWQILIIPRKVAGEGFPELSMQRTENEVCFAGTWKEGELAKYKRPLGSSCEEGLKTHNQELARKLHEKTSDGVGSVL